MEPKSRRQGARLIDQLFDAGHRFDFFQAVRLLERLADMGRAQTKHRQAAVGYDLHPLSEPVRFRTAASLAFPPGPIVEIKPEDGTADRAGSLPQPPRMTVAFLGLVGPQGVLPDHYTRLVIERVRSGDHALHEFLDLFNHRFVSLFYRAWAKYRLCAAYEQAAAAAERPAPDPITQSLYCFVGLGTPQLRGRLAFEDEALLYYAGHMATMRPIAVSLQQMLRAYFGLALNVEQFCGQWLCVSPEDECRLGAGREACQLGRGALLGRRVWDVQSKFRVRIGPLSYSQFRSYLPSGRAFVAMCQLVRLYAGPEFDFDIQPVLRAEQVPRCRLGGELPSGSQLGWNSWLLSKPMTQDAADAAFAAV